jgi:hypothetical protein
VQFFDELFSLFINMRFEGNPPSEEAIIKLKSLIRRHLDIEHSVLGEFLTYTACSDAGGTSTNSFCEYGEDSEEFIDEFNAIVAGKDIELAKDDSEEDDEDDEDDMDCDNEDYDSDVAYEIVGAFESALEAMEKDGKVLSAGTDM